MSIRSLILMFAVACFSGAGCVGEDAFTGEDVVAEDSSGTVSQEVKSSWSCRNFPPNVKCLGIVSIFSVDVLINNVRALNKTELSILEKSLNNLSITLKDVVDLNVILKHVEIAVLNDFLNKFKIEIDLDDINVCILAVCK